LQRCILRFAVFKSDRGREQVKMINEFKAFINKGNVLDLAVALILGTAFGAIVKSLVDDIIMPPVGKLIGGVDFKALTIDLGGATINYGNFINTIITFVIVAFALFLIIRAYRRMRPPTPAEVATKECPYCLSTIPLGASRCPNCTSQLISS
jgi:large conductance mechanosensitive channel